MYSFHNSNQYWWCSNLTLKINRLCNLIPSWNISALFFLSSFWPSVLFIVLRITTWLLYMLANTLALGCTLALKKICVPRQVSLNHSGCSSAYCFPGRLTFSILFPQSPGSWRYCVAPCLSLGFSLCDEMWPLIKISKEKKNNQTSLK